MTRALSWIPLHDEVGVADRILHQLENHTRKLECVAEDRAAFSQAKERLESGEMMNSKLVVKVVTLFTIVLTVRIFASAQASYCNGRLIAGV